jgi:Fe-S-cluster formation regulator IscX/YfhJ
MNGKFNFWKKKVQLAETEKNQLQKISSFLDSISHRLIEDIQQILNEDVGLNKRYAKEDITSLDFELNQDGYRINLYPMNSENAQLGHKQLLPEYPNGFVNDKNFVMYEEDFDDDEERMDEYDRQLEAMVFDWFNLCWKKAGGLNSKENYTISVHNANKSFDLKRRKWVKK